MLHLTKLVINLLLLIILVVCICLTCTRISEFDFKLLDIFHQNVRYRPLQLSSLVLEVLEVLEIEISSCLSFEIFQNLKTNQI